MKISFFLMASFLSLSVSAQSGAQQREYAAVTALADSVRTLASQDLSCRSHYDCGWVAYGQKACGGPQGYVTASRRNWNLQEIIWLAQRSTMKEGAYNQRWGIQSDCMAPVPPRSNCVNRMCR